jgi:hypothetical protein
MQSALVLHKNQRIVVTDSINVTCHYILLECEIKFPASCEAVVTVVQNCEYKSSLVIRMRTMNKMYYKLSFLR